MIEIRRAEHNKRPGVCYAVTSDGLELPVVDVTHPAFACELSAEKQAAMVEHFVTEQRRFARLPAWLRAAMVRFFMRGSRIGQGLRRSEGTFVDAMTTYLFKLGAKNLGSYAVPVDRRILRSLPAVSVQLRLRDMARFLADALSPSLLASAVRPLHFINIAGGPAMDSLNALILLQREAPGSLAQRRVHVCVLDRDAAGPTFGARALAALCAPAGPLWGTQIELEHRSYDWADTSGLTAAVAAARRRDAILAVSSEGGLFEYGTDHDITLNLRALAEAADASVFVVGSVTRNDEVMQALKLTSRVATQPRGLARFSALVAEAGWAVARSVVRPLSDQVLLLPKR